MTIMEERTMTETEETIDVGADVWKRGYDEGMNAGYAAGYKAGAADSRAYAYKLMKVLANKSAVIWTPGETND